MLSDILIFKGIVGGSSWRPQTGRLAGAEVRLMALNGALGSLTGQVAWSKQADSSGALYINDIGWGLEYRTEPVNTTVVKKATSAGLCGRNFEPGLIKLADSYGDTPLH